MGCRNSSAIEVSELVAQRQSESPELYLLSVEDCRRFFSLNLVQAANFIAPLISDIECFELREGQLTAMCSQEGLECVPFVKPVELISHQQIIADVREAATAAVQRDLKAVFGKPWESALAKFDVPSS